MKMNTHDQVEHGRRTQHDWTYIDYHFQWLQDYLAKKNGLLIKAWTQCWFVIHGIPLTSAVAFFFRVFFPRSRLATLEQQLRVAPQNLEKLRQHLAKAGAMVALYKMRKGAVLAVH